MLYIKRTTAQNPDFVALVKHLDKYLAILDGDEHEFYDQYNQLTDIKYVIVAYIDDTPVGCGAIKHFDATTMEIKRMYVAPQHRGQGIAKAILAALENWAKELSYTHCTLETGIRQTAAVSLYQGCGYKSIACYGQYAGMSNSQCFKKALI